MSKILQEAYQHTQTNQYEFVRSQLEQRAHAAQPLPIINLKRILIKINSNNEWQSVENYLNDYVSNWKSSKPSIIFRPEMQFNLVPTDYRFWPNIPDGNCLAHWKLFLTIDSSIGKSEFPAKWMTPDDVNGQKFRNANHTQWIFNHFTVSKEGVRKANFSFVAGRLSALKNGSNITEQYLVDPSHI